MVQIDRHHELIAKAKKKYTSSVKSVGIRGSIYDGTRNPGPICCISKVTYLDIMAEPGIWAAEKKVLDKVTKVLKTNRHVLKLRFNSGKQEVVIRNVDHGEASRIQQMKLKGFAMWSPA